MVSHSFVAAKFSPHLPPWVVTYGQNILPSLAVKPFLALHIHSTEKRRQNLLVISSLKPSDPSCEYLVLNVTEQHVETEGFVRTLTVVPPLPFKSPLYLIITPRINARFEDKEAYQQLFNMEKYQLDAISFQTLTEVLQKARPSIPGVKVTGGDDEPERYWDTWSLASAREGYGIFTTMEGIQYCFDLVPFKSLSEGNEELDPYRDIFNQLHLLHQLTLDYTWKGVTATTTFIQSFRQSRPLFKKPLWNLLLPDILTNQPEPSVCALRTCTPYLQSFPNATGADEHGEEDKDEDEEEEEEDFDENDWPSSHVGELITLPKAVEIPAVIANDIKIIMLDLNVIVDCDGPLQDMLVEIFSCLLHQYVKRELLALYVEYETLRAANGQPNSPSVIIQDIANYFSITLNETTVRSCLEHLGQPRLRKNIESTLESYIKNAYSLILLIPSSSLDAIKLVPPHIPHVVSATGSWDWESIAEKYSSLRRDQILVVTSNIYRMAEPASKAGFPTAFIKYDETRSSLLKSIPTAPTTMTYRSLDDLLKALTPRDPKLLPQPEQPVRIRIPRGPMRIRDCYQINKVLGTGSFGEVYAGFQVHTGAEVALKIEFDDTGSSLPYEAAVYAQLQGIHGIPRIHWTGYESQVFVIVMDRLGPNLEQLRRTCRGRLGLKTVLMLAEQMLSTFEAIHSRGIIVRDVKPLNFAVGYIKEFQILHTFDFGLAKLWVDPTTGKHAPFRKGRARIGTPRYISGNVHLGLEASRRDDIESIGFVLLHLLHGRLPWQGICARNIASKMRRIGEMKRGKALEDLLAHKDTPKCLVEYFRHCRSLEFEDKPDYRMLRRLFKEEAESHGWKEYDWEYDWLTGEGETGTLLPGEYKLDLALVDPFRYKYRQTVL